MIIPFQIYRHFKGGLYLVISTAMDSDTLALKVTYLSLDGSNKVWVRDLEEFESPVPKDRENPTGQEKRFEPVKTMDSILSQCTLENLLKELKGRPDSPFNELDIEGYNDKVAYTEYSVSELRSNETGAKYLHNFVFTDTLEEAQKFMQNNLGSYSSRAKIYKINYVEMGSFD